MNNKHIYNYHTHTFYCGHAKGNAEDYVKMAIENGYKELGFSDHVPFPNVSQPTTRMEMSDIDNYLNDVNKLKVKYKDKIKIYAGFEAEYDPYFDSYFEYLFNEKKIDYLILGNHFSFVKGKPKEYYCNVRNDFKKFKDYINSVILGMKSGFFKYVAHPDLILNSDDKKTDPKLYRELQKIIDASIEYDVPLEINMQGAKYKFSGNPFAKVDDISLDCYPYEKFWEMVGKTNAKVIIGLDAHNPSAFEDNELNFAYKLVNDYHLNLIEKINID